MGKVVDYMNKNSTQLGFIILIFCVLYVALSNMLLIYNTPSLLINTAANIYLFLVITILFLFQLITVIAKETRISNSVIVAIIFGLISLYSTINSDNKSLIASFVATFIWVEVFFLSYIYSYRKVNWTKLIKIMSLALCLMIYLYVRYNVTPIFVSPSSINSIYYIILLLPFILCINNYPVKIVGVVTITICAMISLKRTAVLAIVIALVTYIFVQYYVKVEKLKRLIICFCALSFLGILLIIIYNYLLNTLDLDIWGRFRNIGRDGGSNRDIIFQYVWTEQKNSTFVEWLIGRGHEGVFLCTQLGSSSHNDFLEVLFDYGLLGFLGYLIFIITLIVKCIEAIKKDYNYASVFTASIVMFIIISMFSHLIIIPTYFLFLCMFWGIVLGDLEREK